MSQADASAPAPGPVLRIEGHATPEEVAAVTAAVTMVVSAADEPEPAHESGWVIAARLEAQGHPQVSTLRHIAAHASTH